MRRLALIVVVSVAVLFALATFVGKPFPPDTTPEGAYLRIAKSLGDDAPRDIFAYLETEAQWASYSIRDARKRAIERIRGSYPAGERERASAELAPFAEAPDGADVFALYARRRGWVGRLRKDLSGIASTEVNGERATVVTVRGTRYPFRRRDNGIWGLTMFTADLLAESEKATRDLGIVERAADDYDHAKAR